MKCPHCGADVPSSGRFCLSCGENISFLNFKQFQSPSAKVNLPAGEMPSRSDEKKPPVPEEKPSFASLDTLLEQLNALPGDQPVTDKDRITAVKRRLTTWADAIPHHGIQRFGEKIEIISVRELANYYVRLLTECESRSGITELKKPYEGEPVNPNPLLKQKISSAWDFPVTEKDGDKSEKSEYRIEQSFRKQKCFECAGKGMLACDRCRGDKELQCPKCEGLKKKRCEKCKGSKKITCWTCSGKGVIIVPGEGSKETPCFDCQGQGSSTCKNCDDGFFACTTCRSTGSIACESCKGQGMLSCQRCAGHKEILNYLGFTRSVTSFNDMNMAVDPRLPKKFPLKSLKDYNAGKTVIQFTTKQLPIKEFLPSQVKPYLKSTIEGLVSSFLTKNPQTPNQRITRQVLKIDHYPVTEVMYRFLQKEYRMYVYLNDKEVFSEKNPIGDMKEQLFASAQDQFKRGDLFKAQQILITILRIERTHQRALELTSRIKKKHFVWFILVGLGGGLVAGSGIVALVAVLKHSSLNYKIPCTAVGLLSLFIGLCVGLGWSLVSRMRPLDTATKKRTPFLVTIGIVWLIFIILVFVFKYDPIKKRDYLQFVQEYQQALPYGIPAVPWDGDIRALTQLIEKFKPTGIDVSKAEKGLRKLNALKKEKTHKGRAESRRKRSRSKRSANRYSKKKVKQKNQDAFNSTMDRYENMVIQGKLVSRKQKITYVTNMIRKYKNKGINIKRANQELVRLKKKVKKKRKTRKK